MFRHGEHCHYHALNDADIKLYLAAAGFRLLLHCLVAGGRLCLFLRVLRGCLRGLWLLLCLWLWQCLILCLQCGRIICRHILYMHHNNTCNVVTPAHMHHQLDCIGYVLCKAHFYPCSSPSPFLIALLNELLFVLTSFMLPSTHDL